MTFLSACHNFRGQTSGQEVPAQKTHHADEGAWQGQSDGRAGRHDGTEGCLRTSCTCDRQGAPRRDVRQSSTRRRRAKRVKAQAGQAKETEGNGALEQGRAMGDHECLSNLLLAYAHVRLSRLRILSHCRPRLSHSRMHVRGTRSPRGCTAGTSATRRMQTSSRRSALRQSTEEVASSPRRRSALRAKAATGPWCEAARCDPRTRGRYTCAAAPFPPSPWEGTCPCTKDCAQVQGVAPPRQIGRQGGRKRTWCEPCSSTCVRTS